MNGVLDWACYYNNVPNQFEHYLEIVCYIKLNIQSLNLQLHYLDCSLTTLVSFHARRSNINSIHCIYNIHQTSSPFGLSSVSQILHVAGSGIESSGVEDLKSSTRTGRGSMSISASRSCNPERDSKSRMLSPLLSKPCINHSRPQVSLKVKTHIPSPIDPHPCLPHSLFAVAVAATLLSTAVAVPARLVEALAPPPFPVVAKH